MSLLTTQSDFWETEMHVKNLLGKRTAAIVLTAMVGFGLSSCSLPAATPAASSGSPTDPVAAAVFQQLNANRAANGLPALTWNSKLASIAASWSQQMASSGSLTHQNLGTLLSSPDFAGFTTLGENILQGPSGMTASEMETSWMNSPPHRANILSGAFNVVGIAYTTGADGRRWAVEDFGGI